MIPRLIHHIWLGPRPVPTEWVEAWRDMHPDWEYRLWREADLEALPMVNRAAYRWFLTHMCSDGMARGALACWHGASDVARLEILAALGGVYVDIDSRPLRSLEDAPFMAADAFAAYEPLLSQPGRVANGTLGAVPGAEVIRTNIAFIGAMTTWDPPWDTVGGTSLTAAFLLHRRCCDARVLPARTFYPTDHTGRATPGTETPYCEHFWATTNARLPLRVVVLVPRRAGDPVRDRAWKFVRGWWERSGWPIFEGHHDDGPFNAAAARNLAAAAAGEWEVAVFADADTVPGNLETVRQAGHEAVRTGRLVRPFRRYWMLDEGAAESFMAGQRPTIGMRQLGEQARGGLAIVPRRLWDAVGGYDERFVGWGSEDSAFELACVALGGRLRQLQGDVYHLWHPVSPTRAPDSPTFALNVALRRRYEQAARRPAAMRALLAERFALPEPHPQPAAARAPARFALVVVSNGRGALLEQAMSAFTRHVTPTPDVTLICDDSGDPAYFHWMRERWPEARYDAHRHLGHGPAIRQAWQRAADLPADWVLWLEEDMEFRHDVDLRDIVTVIEASGVVQMVLRRNAHFPDEMAAGATQVERFPRESFVEKETAGHAWLEHRLFYSLNPHLVRRSFLRRHHWPAVPNSEHRFGLRLFRDRAVRVGLWGGREEPPLVHHLGTERTGSGY